MAACSGTGTAPRSRSRQLNSGASDKKPRHLEQSLAVAPATSKATASSSTAMMPRAAGGTAQSGSGGNSNNTSHDVASALDSSGTLESNLRQLAMLQALVARQQELVRSVAQSNGHSQIVLPSTVETGSGGLDFAHSSSPFDATPHDSLTSSSLIAQHQHGLQRPTSNGNLTGFNVNPTDLNWSTALELAQAQQQLTDWSQTVFRTTDMSATTSPLLIDHTGPPTPLPTPASPSSSSFDWPTLYSAPVVPPTTPFTSTYTPIPSYRPLDEVGHATINSVPPFSAARQLEYNNGSVAPEATSGNGNDATKASNRSQKPRLRRSSRSLGTSAGAGSPNDISPRQASKSSTDAPQASTIGVLERRDSSQVPAEELFESLNEQRPSPLKYGTPEEIEEDKRMRNLLASARFRAKKKMKNEQLAQSAHELRQKVRDLELQRNTLRAENAWLRELVSERTEVVVANKSR
ncbi:hypothetical protein OIO90_002802 [Microbotryomycetes sp. JL221]|nr:hypothetical protein OIO90_002802 [Microbotryomycetes sp. JL221]